MRSRMRTRVFITIDTEFSLGGAFIATASVAQLAGWMQRGIDTFARWRLRAPAKPSARNDA